jgi:hypothetical protein
LKIRSRRFKGRCSRHKRYNPAIDGAGGIRGGCARCTLLLEIWETSLKLNQLIRKFDPKHDDLEKLPTTDAAQADSPQLDLPYALG